MFRILMVPVIMGCALVGTIGMIKGIEKCSPDEFKKKTPKKREDDNK